MGTFILDTHESQANRLGRGSSAHFRWLDTTQNPRAERVSWLSLATLPRDQVEHDDYLLRCCNHTTFTRGLYSRLYFYRYGTAATILLPFVFQTSTFLEQSALTTMAPTNSSWDMPESRWFEERRVPPKKMNCTQQTQNTPGTCSDTDQTTEAPSNTQESTIPRGCRQEAV